MSIHSGHRQRLKEQYLNNGLDGFTDYQVLELLLFFAIPRIDTSPIAHALMDRFETLDRVMEAPASELMQVPGVGHNSVMLLKLINDAGRYYQVRRSENVKILNNVNECGQYMMPYFHGRPNETVFLLCLDAKCKVIACEKVGEGSVNSASVPIRRIVELALANHATSVVLAHNHPSGIAVPSSEDVVSTRRTASALAAVDIILVDHIIIADDDFVTLGQSGLYQQEGTLYG
jgi:DNA repair protein RadC